MLYTIPDYYQEFQCVADQCEDTCCAGWQIVIDQKSLKQYRALTGRVKRQVKKNIDWKEQIFKQDQERRCAFLKEDNLCRMYQMLGEKSLCKTCRLYPRHIEEFEGVREISLSLSCPEVARILLGKTEPVHFLNYEKPGDEEYPDFDLFLYSALVEVREQVIGILQDRSLDMDLRIALALAIAHDMQVHVKKKQLFTCADIPGKYKTDQARTYVKEKMHTFMRDIPRKWKFAKRNFDYLQKLELLNPNWFYWAAESRARLYEAGEENYQEQIMQFQTWLLANKTPWSWDILREQLMVYFVFTYFCGAVYDERIYAKMQMAIFSTFIIEEMLRARWIMNEGALDMEDIREIVYHYSREIEHSDKNLETVEKIMEGDPWICVQK